MISRNAVRLAACCTLALGSAAALPLRAFAQGAPFTIRRPPDGSTVRETVRVQIPRSSIGEKSFVVVYIDGKFDVALDPNKGQESLTDDAGNIKGAQDSRFFTYIWNTKANNVSDGPHSVRAVLFDPAPGGVGDLGVTQRSTSEVKITVANKIHDGPSSLNLHYRYPEGHNIEYARQSKSVRGGGGTLSGVNADQDLAAINSKLLLGVLSSGNLALVRNKLTSLSILSNGQETTYPASQLSGSMYQELDAQGQVHYETGTTAGLTEFTTQGLPVDNTLELPILPRASVAVGQTWTTPSQRIDVPGLPVALQPKVRLQNTLVDLEWEGNYRTAKIHQHADDVKLPSDFSFGAVPLLTSTATFDRDIYIAYTSGTLVKMSRTLTIKGRTSIQPADAAPSGGGGGMMGMSGGGGMMGMAGSGGGMMGMAGGGKPRPGAMGMGGSGGAMGRPGGMPGGMSGMGGSGGMMSGGGRPGGMPGMPGGMMGGGGREDGGGRMGGSGGPMGPPRGMGGGMMGMSGGGGGFGGAQGQSDYPITLKAVTDTELLRITSA